MALAEASAGASPKREFPRLPAEAIDYLSAQGETQTYPAGAVLCDRAPQPHFVVILSGEAEVRLVSDDGLVLQLSRVGAGATFGEVSSIRGTAGSSVVLAVSEVTTLTCSAETLHQAIEERPDIQKYLLQHLAASLQEARREAWEFFRRSHALNRLLEHRPSGPLIARSSAMRAVEKALHRQATSPEPLLILGEPGTGKFYAAAKLHELANNPKSPFIAVDAQDIIGRGRKVLFGAKVIASVVEDGKHQADFGAVHLAHEGVLVIRHLDKVSLATQRLMLAFLKKHAAHPEDFPRTRLVLTCSVDLDELVREGELLEELATILRRNTLTMPPLSERRKDILRLARLFLSERGDEKDLSRDAGTVLFGQRYSQRNVTELRETVQLAALMAPGREILPVHLQTGPKDEHSPAETELTAFRFAQHVLREPVVNLARAATFAGFVAVILTGLFLPNHWGAGLANGFVWAVWEPALILSFLLGGRLWCSVCPLSLAGRLAQRVFTFDREHPELLRKWGPIASMIGVVVIIWAEHAFDMLNSPWATGALLALLMSCSALLAMVFRREAWCRSLCPLGTFGAAFSAASALQLRATPAICTTYCREHSCIDGSEKGPGCPVYHHPLNMRPSHDCKLCLNCLRTCPHGSVKIYLRAPLQTLWKAGSLSPTLAPFALSLAALGLIAQVLARHEDVWIEHRLAMLGVALLCAALGAVSSRLLHRAFRTEIQHDPALPARLSFAILVLAWGPLFAYQLGHVPAFADFHVQAQPGTLYTLLFGTHQLSLSGMAEIPVVLLAGLLAHIALYRIYRRLVQLGARRSRLRWRVLALVILVYWLATIVVASLHSNVHAPL